MTRKERLTATLQARPVDHPPVSFYEVMIEAIARPHATGRTNETCDATVG